LNHPHSFIFFSVDCLIGFLVLQQSHFGPFPSRIAKEHLILVVKDKISRIFLNAGFGDKRRKRRQIHDDVAERERTQVALASQWGAISGV